MDERAGLLNRCTMKVVPLVRIQHSPQKDLDISNNFRIFVMFFEIIDNNALFDYRLGHQVFILKRRVRLPYRVQIIHQNRSHRISPLMYE